MDLGLQGKVALVTAASQGLGRACAEALAAEGVRVAICSRSRDRVTAAAIKISRQTGGEVEGFVCDLTKKCDIKHLVTQVYNSFGAIDVLVFNHGNPPPGSFGNVGLEQWQQGLNLCLWPAIHLCHAVVPIMKEKRWGRIIFISSVFAKEPDPNYIVSSTLRAGLLGFAKCLALELAPYQITVNTVLAGYFDTPLVRNLAKEEGRKRGVSTNQVLKQWTRLLPTGVMPKPLVLGQLVAWLCSEQAFNITGAAIPSDAGLLKSAF